MRIKIRIYNPYDLDIIALTEAPGFSVANAMKQTLRYYAAGKKYLIEIPVLTEHLENDRYVKGFYVELDDVADAQAIALIESIPSGLRNSFMKSIFRASFEVAPVSLYIGDGGAEYVASLIANPRYGRYPVQREIIDPVYLAEHEIGVAVSDEQLDVAKMPQGSKVQPPAKSKPATETLRDVTKTAYENSARKADEKKQRQKDAVEKKDEQADKNASDLDDLLDSIM